MKDWQLDVIRANEAAKEWEAINAEDPCKDKLIESSVVMQWACKHMDEAVYWLAQAAERLDGTPMEPKVRSIIDSITDLYAAVVNLKVLYAQGKRE